MSVAAAARRAALVCAVLGALAACGEPARGWPPGAKPMAAAGLQVNAFASGLAHPRWLLVLPNGDVLVAEMNAPVRPAGPIHHHWTKNLVASPDAGKLHVSVGSNSNVAERGMAAQAQRAAIWEVDLVRPTHRVFATGLRNPNGMAWTAGGALLVADDVGNVVWRVTAAH